MGERDDLIIYRLDELKEDIRQLGSNVNRVLEDHEQRIRTLEITRPRTSNNGDRKKFWASLIALAMSFVALAGTIWKSMR